MKRSKAHTIISFVPGMVKRVAATHGSEWTGLPPWCFDRGRFRIWPYQLYNSTPHYGRWHFLIACWPPLVATPLFPSLEKSTRQALEGQHHLETLPLVVGGISPYGWWNSYAQIGQEPHLQQSRGF
jgi:hypothetical protein